MLLISGSNKSNFWWKLSKKDKSLTEHQSKMFLKEFLSISLIFLEGVFVMPEGILQCEDQVLLWPPCISVLTPVSFSIWPLACCFKSPRQKEVLKNGTIWSVEDKSGRKQLFLCFEMLFRRYCGISNPFTDSLCLRRAVCWVV